MLDVVKGPAYSLNWIFDSWKVSNLKHWSQESVTLILHCKERYLDLCGVFLEEKSIYLYSSKCRFSAVYVPHWKLLNGLLVIVWACVGHPPYILADFVPKRRATGTNAVPFPCFLSSFILLANTGSKETIVYFGLTGKGGTDTYGLIKTRPVLSESLVSEVFFFSSLKF